MSKVNQKGIFSLCMFAEFICSFFLQLPSVNSTPLDQLQSGCVVKYRCMVQDVFDPQYFVGRYSVTNKDSGHTRIECGSFRDVPLIGVRTK